MPRGFISELGKPHVVRLFVHEASKTAWVYYARNETGNKPLRDLESTSNLYGYLRSGCHLS